MSYVRRVLQSGETLVYEAKISWATYLPGLLVLLAAAAIFVVVALVFGLMIWGSVAGVILLLLALWLLGSAWFSRWTTEIAITDRRIILKRGFIRRDTIEMSVEKVESVDVNQSLLGRLLDYGDILVRGTGAGLAPLRHIASPLAFRSKLIGTSHHLQASTAAHQD
jgi:uncharacterized membrane protein YdbT with pleckstrin-like domain